jgi:hypothetical protein
MGKLDQFLEWFHDGRESEYDKILKVFQTTRRFLQAAIKYGEKDQIDIEYIPDKEWKNDSELFDFIAENGFLDDVDYNNLEEDNLKNYYLEWMMNKDTNSTLKFICDDILTDVEIRDDGYWLRLRDRDELAGFFKSSSRRSDYDLQEIAKQVLGDGLDYEYYSDTTYDVYNDVIKELNEKNIQILADYILKNIGNTDLNSSDYNSDFFEELTEIQARDGIFQITQDNVMSLIDDKEAMEELMNGDLSDLKSELYSIHSNAYNGAYENMIYKEVMEGLKEYFSSPIEEVAKQVGEKTKYTSYIKISDFYGNVMTFIGENLGSGYSDSILEYHGSYTNMMLQLFNDGVYDAIDFRVDDYPNYKEVDEAINDYLGDYI